MLSDQLKYVLKIASDTGNHYHGIKRQTVGFFIICFPVQVTRDEIEVKWYRHGISKQNLI